MQQVLQTIESKSERETVEAGKRFSSDLHAGDVVGLIGELGSGKTRFAKGICDGLNVKQHTGSPTFTILNEYGGGRLPVYHFDFYRLRSLRELDEIGFEEYLFGDGICIVEWADVVEEKLPLQRYDVVLDLGRDQNARIIQIQRRTVP